MGGGGVSSEANGPLQPLQSRWIVGKVDFDEEEDGFYSECFCDL